MDDINKLLTIIFRFASASISISFIATVVYYQAYLSALDINIFNIPITVNDIFDFSIKWLVAGILPIVVFIIFFMLGDSLVDRGAVFSNDFSSLWEELYGWRKWFAKVAMVHIRLVSVLLVPTILTYLILFLQGKFVPFWWFLPIVVLFDYAMNYLKIEKSKRLTLWALMLVVFVYFYSYIKGAHDADYAKSLTSQKLSVGSVIQNQFKILLVLEKGVIAKTPDKSKFIFLPWEIIGGYNFKIKSIPTQKDF